MRAAQSLAVHSGIDGVAVLAPAKSNHFPTTDTVEGWDLVMGSERAVGAGRKHGVPVAVTGAVDAHAGVSLGSPVGLALALAVGVEGIETLAVAVPGEPGGDLPVVFPSPIDSRASVAERFDGHEVRVARGDGPLAAVMVLGAERHRVVLDDHSFLAGIALAAAAVVALEVEPATATPAWSHSEIYLRAAVEMGLVIGERTPW